MLDCEINPGSYSASTVPFDVSKISEIREESKIESGRRYEPNQ